MLLLHAGSVFKMADEIDNDNLYEPQFKRPRIVSESAKTSDDREADKLGLDKNGEQANCHQRNETDGKLRSEIIIGTKHVLNENPEETDEMRASTEQGKDSSVGKASEDGSDILRETCVSEKDVGILEFVANLPGFHGVLKQRYTDFIVRERDLQGNIVRLTDTSLPRKEKSQEFGLDILSEEEKMKIKQVIDDEEKKTSVTLSPDDDKDHRRLVHRAIRENFAFLDSDTVDVGNQKAVRVFHNRDSDGKQRSSRWPAELGDYCWFVLYKENKDTMDAINLLSKLLRIKAGSFGYAGTKDRRAVTTQKVSVYRVKVEQLQELNKSLRNICLGNFQYCKEPLKLGSLSGNHFVITLRNVVGDHGEIEESLKSLKINGFINYFGLQRFGTTSVPTHKIGCALLLSNWSEAVDLLLNPRSGEADDLTAARQHWKDTHDAKETLKRLPKRKGIESDLLLGLVRHGPSGLVKALQSISRNTRLMYVHAYQSYVWNYMASKRIKEHGMQPIVGDLVVASKSAAPCTTDTGPQDKVEFISEPSRTSVTVVTEELIKTGQFTIHDVVLPLPGYDVAYPNNSLKGEYRKIMANDGLDIDNMRHKVKDYSLSGAYRKLLVKPSLTSWRWLRYIDVKQPLVVTDKEAMSGAQEPESVPDGKYWALQLEFTLPTSAYATMALREVLRSDTSSAYQSTLNQE